MELRHALTVLTRMAARKSEQAAHLACAFEGRLEQLAEPALEVAVETGDPIGKVLALKVEDGCNPKLALRLLRLCQKDFFDSSVPLREVAVAATQNSLDFLHARLRQVPGLDGGSSLTRTGEGNARRWRLASSTRA